MLKRIADASADHTGERSSAEELIMRRVIMMAAFAAPILAGGLCAAARAAPEGPGLFAARTIERPVTQVHWRCHNWRADYRPRVYGYYIDYYRPLVRVYYSYSPRVYRWRGSGGCRW